MLVYIFLKISIHLFAFCFIAYYLCCIINNKTICKMKLYSQLTIDEKINLKGNIKAKGLKYGTLPNDWQAMRMDIVRFDMIVDAYGIAYKMICKY